MVMSNSLVIEPKKAIHFKGPYTEKHVTKIVLSNRGEVRLAIRLMTIEPMHYVVKPSKAILDQKQCVTVAIKLLPIKDLATFKVARQKFLIESVPVSSSTTLDMVNEMFKQALVGDIFTKKIVVIFDDLGKPKSASQSESAGSRVTKSMESIRSSDSIHAKEKANQKEEAEEGTKVKVATVEMKEAPAPSHVDSPATAPIAPVAGQLVSVVSADSTSSTVGAAVPKSCPLVCRLSSTLPYVAIAGGIVLAGFFLYRRYTR